MGALQAFAPLSIDMYLPSMPLLEHVFGATTAEVQATLITFFLGFALGQSLYGPVTDRFGRKPPLYFSLVAVFWFPRRFARWPLLFTPWPSFACSRRWALAAAL